MGGGARNNLELFIPSEINPEKNSTNFSWSKRPSYEEILNYKAGNESGPTLVEVLKNTLGVGLIFIRKENKKINSRRLPKKVHVIVMDRFGSEGEITVWKDISTHELVFKYRLISEIDPLGYGELGKGEGTIGTYFEWNDISIINNHRLHNVVAGIGSYLYSKNPSIGDIFVTHSQGWNFGENTAGHGGVHKDEKLTLMMVSGPQIQPGELMARSRYKTLNGKVQVKSHEVYPTVLDAAPTILNWLGYGSLALTRFSRNKSNGFQKHFKKWVSHQRSDLIQNLDHVDGVDEAFEEVGIKDFQFSDFKTQFERLFRFIPKTPKVKYPNYMKTHEDGNQLILR